MTQQLIHWKNKLMLLSTTKDYRTTNTAGYVLNVSYKMLKFYKVAIFVAKVVRATIKKLSKRPKPLKLR